MHSRYSTIAPVAGILLALAVLLSLVLTTTGAAFTDTTSNAGNSWETGTVIISDNDNDVAMFAATDMAPGDVVERCITVTYEGTLDANVRLYSASTAGGTLDPQLNVTVEHGTGTQADCSDFTADGVAPAVTGPTALSSLLGTATDFASGVDTWDGVQTNETRTYHVTVELDPATDNTYQGDSSSLVELIWEAQNI